MKKIAFIFFIWGVDAFGDNTIYIKNSSSASLDLQFQDVDLNHDVQGLRASKSPKGTSQQRIVVKPHSVGLLCIAPVTQKKGKIYLAPRGNDMAKKCQISWHSCPKKNENPVIRVRNLQHRLDCHVTCDHVRLIIDERHKKRGKRSHPPRRKEGDTLFVPERTWAIPKPVEEVMAYPWHHFRHDQHGHLDERAIFIR